MTLLSSYIVLNEKTLQPYKYVLGNKQTRAEGKWNFMSQILDPSSLTEDITADQRL